PLIAAVAPPASAARMACDPRDRASTGATICLLRDNLGTQVVTGGETHTDRAVARIPGRPRIASRSSSCASWRGTRTAAPAAPTGGGLSMGLMTGIWLALLGVL